jgi:protein-L-isoaspartate(D-aspartate) O-methyltransferase
MVKQGNNKRSNNKRSSGNRKSKVFYSDKIIIQNTRTRGCYQSNDALVDKLSTNDFTKNALRMVDRKPFCVYKENCYCDSPSPLILEQTISAPHMHAKAIEYLQEKLVPGASVLDIGSGSGILTAVYGKLVSVDNKNPKKRGKVVGIDLHQGLVNMSIQTIKKNYPELFKYSSSFKILQGSGWDGYPKKSSKERYDAIHVGALADSVPMNLLNQLKHDGIMLLPLKLGGNNYFCIITKDKDDNILIDPRESVRYVPLVKGKKK